MKKLKNCFILAKGIFTLIEIIKCALKIENFNVYKNAV